MLWSMGFSLRWLLLLQSTGCRHVGFSSCGIRAQLLHGMWDLPGPGFEPMSPALAGGFLTTAPPGKPYMAILKQISRIICQLELCLLVYLPIYLFIYLWLCWVFVAVHRLSLVAASGAATILRCGVQSSRCGGFCCCGAWALGAWASVVVGRGLQSAGSVVVAHGLSCSTACGIFPDQGSNPCPLQWQVNS